MAHLDIIRRKTNVYKRSDMTCQLVFINKLKRDVSEEMEPQRILLTGKTLNQSAQTRRLIRVVTVCMGNIDLE